MKVMAIDLGDARTGIAVSDAMGWLTGFTTVIHSWNKDKTAQEIAALVKTHRPERIVMGFPRNMDGSGDITVTGGEVVVRGGMDGLIAEHGTVYVTGVGDFGRRGTLCAAV